MKMKRPVMPLSDQIFSSTTYFFDLFYLGSVFIHQRLTAKRTQLVIQDQIFSLEDGRLLYNGRPFKNSEQFLVFSNGKLQTIVTNRPQKDCLISATKKAAISLETDALIQLKVNQQSNDYQLTIYPSEDHVYFNQKLVAEGTFSFGAGDNLVVNGLIIECLEKQLKLTSLGIVFTLNPWFLMEEEFQSIYPVTFPDFRRSPRIRLREPEAKIKLVAPKPLETEGKNELLQTIVPPLGMVVLSGATSYLSGGNPIMMLSMGGASLLTTGFSLSSYFTNKKEIKQKNRERESSYKDYMIQEKSRLSLLRQEQKAALEYMNPSMDELALMTKNYHARIYERMIKNEDFLQIRLGTGKITASFTTDYPSVEEDELSKEAQRQLVFPFQTLDKAPIISPLLSQTLGLAGASSVLRTAIQTILFQIAILHSYREVEFVTLISKNDFSKEWQDWRCLPHMAISSLNLRGIVHNPQTRDRVLNSFYQLVIKRRQQVQEAKNEKVRFQPHVVFSILDESWLSGHGLNEFLAEDMSQYGVTVIWAKDTLNMLPETTTTLISYQSNEAACLINQNNEYVNQTFVPNHLPTSYSLAQSIQRLANLNHIEVEKNAIPESLGLLEQYEVKRIEELQIKQRWLEAQPNKSIRSLIGWRGKSDLVYWDLHERIHGPHALVGGTTGSGKSEFLTTYLIGLAINFSPEDIGMLIIDWKGGGIVNTLENLPHFMGAITNLDGAGTTRALASIKAELAKRQREFAKYGVNNINSYMSLYKQRDKPKSDILYPVKPLPHLILVSDEFAELKSNVPEFLDELTSVARIGRSLGVHLILATQKPSGVVNDQIEANSTSKIALKMASVQDSNELLKTPDAAQITNPGRGYLKVGENEVYELFQSGYAGFPYDPDKEMIEVIDERIYKINELGQTELLYDPEEDLIQVKDTSDLPTQLEAIIATIRQLVEESDLCLPDKPWLPNLSQQIFPPSMTETEERSANIPIGVLDIPSEQKKKIYLYDVEKNSHTVILASPGYGKSTLLQTIALNLATKNTPNQVQFNLLDFGNNGMLPLKDLPQVADIVSLEEDTKLQKMLDSILISLVSRKELFKKNGVANFVQYESKTHTKLPLLINFLDSYDGLSLEDKRKDSVDSLLLQLLREGASLGIYLIFTANRPGAIRMNMMSTIATKIVLYLNDENEVHSVLGREVLVSQAIQGRGQIMLDTPTAIQFYLPTYGKDSTEILENLEQQVNKLDQAWAGSRPKKIPMVPAELTKKDVLSQTNPLSENILYLGLNRETALIAAVDLFKGDSLGVFMSSNKQFRLIVPWFMEQVDSWKVEKDSVIIDVAGTMANYAEQVTTYIDRTKIVQQNVELKEALTQMVLDERTQRLVMINGIAELVDKLFLTPEEVNTLFSTGHETLQVIFFDLMSKVGNNYGGLTLAVKENIDQLFFGGSLQDQQFFDTLTYAEKSVSIPFNVLHFLNEDILEAVVAPMEDIK